MISDSGHELVKAHTNGVHYSGTGDLFAAILLGGLLNGKDVASVTKRAGDFIRTSVEETEKMGISGNEGIAFEKNLGMLIS